MIGEPQPVIVALERQGWIRGKVLDDRGVIVRDEHAVALDRRLGELVELPAWLVRARRV